MNVSQGQREYILEILNYEYIIPEEYCECVKEAIMEQSTRSRYSEAVLEAMVRKPQSISTSISSIRNGNLSLFRGKFAEWLACIEYNALKNKGNVVMTIVNPDPTSKADLLHIIRKGDKYEAIPGPDIKCGGSTYVFNQWKKIVNSRYDIPMVDMDDVLTTEEGLRMLTEKQREEFEQLKLTHPGKKPIKSEWNKQDINRLILDYLKYVSDGITPANTYERPFVATTENRDRIKNKLSALSKKAYLQSDWGEFRKKAFDLPNIQNNYLSSMTLAKIEHEKLEELTQEKVATKNENTEMLKPGNKIDRINRIDESYTVSKQKKKAVITGIANFLGYDTLADLGIDVATLILEPLAEAAVSVLVDKIFSSSVDSVGGTYDKRNKKKKYQKKVSVKRNANEKLHVNFAAEAIHDSSPVSSPSEPTATFLIPKPITETTHKSPKEHTVKEHKQLYHTKEGTKEKYKEPYQRGKKE